MTHMHVRSSKPTIKNHLFALRRNRGYRQKQLASLVGCSVDRLSRYERGVGLPPLDTALLLEIALGARLCDIYLDLHHELERLILERATRLPPRLGSSLRERVLGRD